MDAPQTPWTPMPDQSAVEETGPMLNALSVDVEDYYHVWALAKAYPKASWHLPERRVERSTQQVLELFERSNVKATFFILGIVAEEFPELVRSIAEQGHEIASHGYAHDKVFELSSQAFAEDLRKTKATLEDISGQPVIGYRAPSFSINERTPWAYERLVETGHLYSSSLHPIAHDHYGAPDQPRHLFRCERTGLIEIPVAVVERLGRRFSCGGGGFFRLLPYLWSRTNIARLNAQDSIPATFYFHPWEIDPGQPVARGISGKSKLRHYSNLARMEPKLERLLRDFRWDRIDRVYDLERVMPRPAVSDPAVMVASA